MTFQAEVVVPLAPGFEEIEAVTIVDVLRRAGRKVAFAALKPGPVAGAHGISIAPDCGLDEIDVMTCKLVVLPGGLPGATNLRDDPRVPRLLNTVAERGGWVAAICAAPIAVAKAGLHAGKRVTCYPGFEAELKGGSIVADRVAVDGKLVTSRGPGTAMEFALALVRALDGADKAAALQKALLAS